MRLAGKIAIVTGVGSDFGESITSTSAREGARVVVSGLNTEAGKRVASTAHVAGGDTRFVQADVSNGDPVTRLLSATLARYGDLYIVVGNAGTTHKDKPLLQIIKDELDRVMAANVKSIYWTAHHIVPYFRKRGGGMFINVASTTGIRLRPGLVWYNANKDVAITAGKVMAAELGPDKIRMNCVNPIVGATGPIEQFMGVLDTPENRARFPTTTPMGRLSTPQDVADTCLYLTSDETEFITGACLEVDGGRCI